jgi:hypothetical protein
MDKQHIHAAQTGSLGKKRGNAIREYNIDMQNLHAAWTSSMDEQ